MLEPKRIIRNGIATIVFWNDGTKTIVKCAEDDEPDYYMAFCAAYCKKVFGSNSQLKRVIKNARNAKAEKKKDEKVFSSMSELVQDTLADVNFKFPMPGCLNCKHVNGCPDKYFSHARHCGAYASVWNLLF